MYHALVICTVITVKATRQQPAAFFPKEVGRYLSETGKPDAIQESHKASDARLTPLASG